MSHRRPNTDFSVSCYLHPLDGPMGRHSFTPRDVRRTSTNPNAREKRFVCYRARTAPLWPRSSRHRLLISVCLYRVSTSIPNLIEV